MSEHEEQCIYIGEMKRRSNSIPGLGLVYAVPNFRRQSIQTAAYMYAEGLQPGMPDTCLPIARSGYYSLRIEFKYSKNKLTAEQAIWLQLLALEDNLCCVFYDGWEAFRLAMDYEAGKVIKQQFPTWFVFHDKDQGMTANIVTKSPNQLLTELENERANRRNRNRNKGYQCKRRSSR